MQNIHLCIFLSLPDVQTLPFAFFRLNTLSRAFTDEELDELEELLLVQLLRSRIEGFILLHFLRSSLFSSTNWFYYSSCCWISQTKVLQSVAFCCHSQATLFALIATPLSFLTLFLYSYLYFSSVFNSFIFWQTSFWRQHFFFYSYSSSHLRLQILFVLLSIALVARHIAFSLTCMSFNTLQY